MKPGLRKVVALILATATLFGSGASAVSAAYADDTTMGTSTRIQAEPDVKTTTGGDEAATKPDCVLSSCYRPVWREFSFRKSGRF